MSETKIEPGQVWRYRDEREDRNVVVDSVDRLSDGTVYWATVRNARTGRKSVQRASTLRRYYRLQVRDA